MLLHGFVEQFHLIQAQNITSSSYKFEQITSHFKLTNHIVPNLQNS